MAKNFLKNLPQGVTAARQYLQGSAYTGRGFSLCGDRYGIYLMTESAITEQQKKFSWPDPIPHIDQATWSTFNIQTQGQTFVEDKLNNRAFFIDVIGQDYWPADVLWEYSAKGGSNKLLNEIPQGMTQKELASKLAHWFKYQEDIEVIYIHSKAWIHPDDRHWYYADRQYARILAVNQMFCPLGLPEHAEDQLPYKVPAGMAGLVEEYPMCVGLLFEDLPLPYGDKRPSDRLIQRQAGDLYYYGALTPKLPKGVTIRRDWGKIFTGKVKRIEVVYPDDEKKADLTVKALRGIGLNIAIDKANS